MRLAGLILAAGYSSRMGNFKPLLKLGGQTLLEWAVNLLRGAGAAEIGAVAGHRADELHPHLRRLDVRAMVNPHPEAGMFSSVVAGITAMAACRADALAILPVDIPLVRLHTLRRLVEAFTAGRGQLVHPVFLGRRGHPPLIGSEHLPALAAWRGPGGLRGWFEQQQSRCVDIAVADAGILADADTPEQLRQLEARLERWAIPSAAECEALMTQVLAVKPALWAHCRKVAQVAGRIAEALAGRGYLLDKELIVAAARLHDMLRDEPEHAACAAARLRQMGFEAVADLVAEHMQRRPGPGVAIGPQEVLFLADKLVAGDRVVGLEDRFAERLARHCSDGAALAAVQGRLELAQCVQQRVERALGGALASLLADVRGELP